MVDNYKRHIFLKNEIKKRLLKSIILNKDTSIHRRYLASFYLTRFPKFASRCIPVNRCIISGRSSGVNRQTNFSRFIFRNSVYNSTLPGFRRASW